MICRGCHANGEHDFWEFCDLGVQPLANTLLTKDQLLEPVTTYPLRPMLCEKCMLVQLPDLVSPEQTFSDYPYFSSQSATYVEHSRQHADDLIKHFLMGEAWRREHAGGEGRLVVEIASNDGYMLRHFIRGGIERVYGIEPARNVADHATKRGIPTFVDFFSSVLASKLVESKDGLVTGGRADVIIANNVLAHVPNLSSFLVGLRIMLAPEGVVSIEVPWLKDLVDGDECGTIYHEHLSYFLLHSIEYALTGQAGGLRVFDVEHFPEIHGGTMRLYLCHGSAQHEQTERVREWQSVERGWLVSAPLHHFGRQPSALKQAVWSFLLSQKVIDRYVCGYGAAAKAATVLSYCGVGPELMPWIADTTPAKWDRYLGGTQIHITTPLALTERRPDVIWVLAPNWIEEIKSKLRDQCDWHPHVAWQDGTEIRMERL